MGYLQRCDIGSKTEISSNKRRSKANPGGMGPHTLKKTQQLEYLHKKTGWCSTPKTYFEAIQSPNYPRINPYLSNFVQTIPDYESIYTGRI